MLRPIFSRIVATVLAAAVLAPGAAVAVEGVAQGARWLKICTSERRVDEAMCAGFIMGMEETQFLRENSNQFCPPPMFTVDEQKKIIVKYLQKNSGRLGEAFARLAVDAMREAFPCRH